MQPKRWNWARHLPLSKPLDAARVLRDLRVVTRQEQPKKLLLVDDNDLSLYILRELLDRPWLNLVEAHNGREALEMIDREHPDAVILDLVMPGMGGFEVLQKLRASEQTRRLPVIVYTSKLLTADEKTLLTRSCCRPDRQERCNKNAVSGIFTALAGQTGHCGARRKMRRG